MWIKLKTINWDEVDDAALQVSAEHINTAFVLAKQICKIKVRKKNHIIYTEVSTDEYGSLDCLDSPEYVMSKVNEALSEPMNGKMRGAYAR